MVHLTAALVDHTSNPITGTHTHTLLCCPALTVGWSFCVTAPRVTFQDTRAAGSTWRATPHAIQHLWGYSIEQHAAGPSSGAVDITLQIRQPCRSPNTTPCMRHTGHCCSRLVHMLSAIKFLSKGDHTPAARCKRWGACRVHVASPTAGTRNEPQHTK